METEKTVDTEKLEWHTPELRKNSISENTKFAPIGIISDGSAPGIIITTPS